MKGRSVVWWWGDAVVDEGLCGLSLWRDCPQPLASARTFHFRDTSSPVLSFLYLPNVQ